MTNILASIVLSLATNTVTTDNTQYEMRIGRCPMESTNENGLILSCTAIHWEKTTHVTVPATEKTETTTIIETRRLQFEFEGKPISVELGQRVVDEKKTTFRLKQQWEKQVDLGILGYPNWVAPKLPLSN